MTGALPVACCYSLKDMPWSNVSRRALLPLLVAAAVRAQCPNSIVAGPPSTFAGDGQPAISAWLLQPNGISLDASGILYIADTGNNRVRRVTTDGVIHTVAGPDTLNAPAAVLAAPDGSVYIADTGNNQIRRITSAGALTTVAGTGHPGFSGDNGAAAAAELNGPRGMALDAQGRLYFADTNNGRIRRVDAKGIIATVAGSSFQPYGDGSPATSATLSSPQAVAIAADGTMFIADPGEENIRRVAPDGTISTLGTAYEISATNLTLLSDGSLLIADGDLLRLSTDGSTLDYYARAGTAVSAALGPSGVYYTSTQNVVYRAASAASEPAIFAGQFYFGNAPDQTPALGPIFGSPGALVVGPDGSIWVADPGDSKIRKILPNGTQRVVISGMAGTELALDSTGNLYAAAAGIVWKVTPAGTAAPFAGGGYSPIPPMGTAIPATSAALAEILGAVTDSAGNVFVLSEQYGYQWHFLIARITPGGQLTTIWDSTGVSGLIAEPSFNGYQGFAIDAQGDLVVLVNPRQILRIRPDGSGIAENLNAPDYVVALATSPSGEIFYVTLTGRIQALRSGAVLYNRDIYPAQYYPYYGQVGVTATTTASEINSLLTQPEPGGMPADTVGLPPSLAADALGNLYFSDVNANVIRRFPVNPCFTAAAPQLSVDTPPSPITPQEFGLTPVINSTGTTTTGTTTTGTTSTVPPGNTFFAPGELISLYGSGLGPQNAAKAQIGSGGLVATELASTRVLFDGVPAPVLYASDGRVNTVIPFTMYGYTRVLVQVELNGVLSDVLPLAMEPSAPIVFTNPDATPIVINQDGSLNSLTTPAAAGSIVTIYGSGFGRTTPEGTDGHVATVPLPQPVLPVSATVDGAPATVLYAGDAAGMVEGIVQVNIRLPQDYYYGDVQVSVGNEAMDFNISISQANSR